MWCLSQLYEIRKRLRTQGFYTGQEGEVWRVPPISRPPLLWQSDVRESKRLWAPEKGKKAVNTSNWESIHTGPEQRQS